MMRAPLAGDIASLDKQFATLVPLAEHLNGVAGSALALNENFRTDLTAVQRWQFAFDYYNWRNPEDPKASALAELTPPIANKIFPFLLERLGEKEDPTNAERALMTRVIIILATTPIAMNRSGTSATCFSRNCFPRSLPVQRVPRTATRST